MGYIYFVFAGLASAFIAACCWLILRRTVVTEITTADLDIGIVAFCVTFIAAMRVQDSNFIPWPLGWQATGIPSEEGASAHAVISKQRLMKTKK